MRAKMIARENFLPVTRVSFALNSVSDWQLARTEISPVEHMGKQRQQIYKKWVQEWSNFMGSKG